MPPGRVAGARRWLDGLLFWSLSAQLLRALASPTPFPGSPFLFPVAPSPHGGLDSRHTTHAPHAASPRVCVGCSEISHCLSDGTKPLMGTEPGAPEWAAEGSAVPWRETAQHACAPGPLSPPLGSATICLAWSHPPSGDHPPPNTKPQVFPRVIATLAGLRADLGVWPSWNTLVTSGPCLSSCHPTYARPGPPVGKVPRVCAVPACLGCLGPESPHGQSGLSFSGSAEIMSTCPVAWRPRGAFLLCLPFLLGFWAFWGKLKGKEGEEGGREGEKEKEKKEGSWGIPPRPRSQNPHLNVTPQHLGAHCQERGPAWAQPRG